MIRVIAFALLIAGAIFIQSLSAAPTMAQHDHDQHAGHGMSGMFLERREVDGYTVTFHVMPADERMDMGGTHHLMVQVKKDGKFQKKLDINSKVIYPDGEAQFKMLTLMDGWYMAGYDLAHQGRHQLLIMFKGAAGDTHKAGVYYPGK